MAQSTTTTNFRKLSAMVSIKNFNFIGTYGEVKKAIHKLTYQERAVKIIQKSITKDVD
jgi:hypothetical protein